MGAFDNYRQEREVIAATDDRLVVVVNEHGRGKASGADVVRDGGDEILRGRTPSHPAGA
jgi:hypothetical protein